MASIPPGAEHIGHGIYTHNGEMHIDAAEMLEECGLSPTKENMETLAALTAKVMAEHNIPYVEREA